MRFLALLVLALALPPAHAQREHGRAVPGAERRLDAAERQRLREQVRGNQMSREEARERWRERHGEERRHSPEEHERLRRDIQDANRRLERRR